MKIWTVKWIVGDEMDIEMVDELVDEMVGEVNYEMEDGTFDGG